MLRAAPLASLAGAFVPGGSSWGPLSTGAVRQLAGPNGAGCGRAAPADWREPLLCHGGDRRRGDRDPPAARRCGAGARGRAEQPGPRCAGRGRAERGRARNCGWSSRSRSARRRPSTRPLASGLLTVDGARLGFRRGIARLAVAAGDLAASPPRLIHARVLDALAAGGCDDDARLAFHAEGAGDGPAAVRLRPRAAARQAAELASHRESAAQFERALRFAARAAPGGGRRAARRSRP